MMPKTILFSIALLGLVFQYSCTQSKKEQLGLSQQSEQQKKTLFIPDSIFKVPYRNNYLNDTSEYSYSRMAESENIALFWSKEYGKTPLLNPDTLKRFDPDFLLKEGERIYRYFVNQLKFVWDEDPVNSQYKMLIFIFGGDEGTAFGGGEAGKVGIFWAPAIRMHKAPFGALAHEMGHSFQYLLDADKLRADSTASPGVGSYPFIEMTSQFMLWQVYPDWMTFENYHLVDFMKQTHLAFLHEKNMYHSAYMLEYWAEKHGPDIISRIWKSVQKGEDPVMTYQRITGIDQKQFNDEVFEAARKFITWDLKRVKNEAKPYANQHTCVLNSTGEGWYQIDVSRCPQNYGYNGIRLNTPKSKTTIRLDFKGVAGSEGFRAIETEKAGWRYGFLAVKKDGTTVCSAMSSANEGSLTFKVPNKTEHLWLIVCGAPNSHFPHHADWKEDNDEQWPYRIKLSGTTLEDGVIQDTQN